MVQEKIVSACQSSNLRWDENYERAIDRLTALGLSDPLGSALFRAKYCNDRESGRRALHLLTHKVAQRTKVEMDYARKLATVATKEFMVDTCEKCHGTGIVGDRGTESQCRSCSGTGLKKYSDTERSLCAGFPVDSWSKHQRRFEIAAECLSHALDETQHRVRTLLQG